MSKDMTKHERNMDRIARMRLLDDGFMKKVFEDKDCTQLLLQVIMGKTDLTVESVQTEYTVKNLQGRGARLDVYASDSKGVLYNVEVQREDKGAVPKRARYNSSLLDANVTEPGDEYEKLPESYVIFITEKDVLCHNEQIYCFERICREHDLRLNDGSHIIYVNAAKQNATPIGQLMWDFSCTKAEDMHYGVLAERVRYFKEDKEGISKMCKIWEEVLEEGKIETAKRK